MADKYINEVGLQTIKTWIQDNFTNKIETVKVNGASLTPDANKAVNVEVPNVNCADAQTGGTTLVSIKTPTNDDGIEFQKDENGVSTKFGNTTPIILASKDYVDENGGKIDVIKVNGTAQTITNKEVNLSVPEVTMTGGEGVTISVPSTGDEVSMRLAAPGMVVEFDGGSLESLTSKTYVDTKFRTEQQVQDAIDAALADITGIDFQVVDALPTTGVKGVIYLLASSGSAPNAYDEYIWVTPEGGTAHYEKIGTTEVDLSDYWTSASGHANSLVAMTVAEVQAILNA